MLRRDGTKLGTGGSYIVLKRGSCFVFSYRLTGIDTFEELLEYGELEGSFREDMVSCNQKLNTKSVLWNLR